MSRPTSSWPALGAALHRLCAADPPPWLSPATLDRARILGWVREGETLRAL